MTTNLEIADSFKSFPLFVTNSTTAWIAPSADCFILSDIAAEQLLSVATSCNIVATTSQIQIHIEVIIHL